MVKLDHLSLGTLPAGYRLTAATLVLEGHIMSVDYTGSSGGETPQETESPMFAPTPMWDRSRKNKKTGAERRSFFENTSEPESSATIGAAGMGAAAGSA